MLEFSSWYELLMKTACYLLVFQFDNPDLFVLRIAQPVLLFQKEFPANPSTATSVLNLVAHISPSCSGLLPNFISGDQHKVTHFTAWHISKIPVLFLSTSSAFLQRRLPSDIALSALTQPEGFKRNFFAPVLHCCVARQPKFCLPSFVAAFAVPLVLSDNGYHDGLL